MKFIFLVLFLTSSSILYSQTFEYKKSLIKDGKINFDFNNNNKYKESFFEQSLPNINFKESQYKNKLIEPSKKSNTELVDNETSTNDFTFRVLLFNPLTLMFIYKKWGISLGINDLMLENLYVDNDKTEIKETDREAALTYGYTYFWKDFSLGIGFSNYSGVQYEVSTSANYATSKSTVASYFILQTYLSYDYSETFEIVSGIHQGNVKYRGIDGECNENGCTDGLKSIYKDIQLINFGLGYKF